MDEKRLQEIERCVQSPVEYGWEACDITAGMSADIRELIAEVRRLRSARDEPSFDPAKVDDYARRMGLPTDFPL